MSVGFPQPLPAGLALIGSDEPGRRWLATLPSLLAECEGWQLRLAVAAALLAGGEAVLELQFPHREAEQGAAALARWNGDGAVQLLAHDPGRHALLLERCRPGTPLTRLDQDAALDVFVELLPRLWRPATAPFPALAEEAWQRAETLPREWERAGRPFERPPLDAALEAIEELAPTTQGEQVLVHQDLHAENVLRAERQPWLTIDPKPVCGEREFALAPIARDAQLGGGRASLLHRLSRLTDELGLDRARVSRWAFLQTLAWSIDDTHTWTEMVDAARWLLEPSQTP